MDKFCKIEIDLKKKLQNVPKFLEIEIGCLRFIQKNNNKKVSQIGYDFLSAPSLPNSFFEIGYLRQAKSQMTFCLPKLSKLIFFLFHTWGRQKAKCFFACPNSPNLFFFQFSSLGQAKSTLTFCLAQLSQLIFFSISFQGQTIKHFEFLLAPRMKLKKISWESQGRQKDKVLFACPKLEIKRQVNKLGELRQAKSTLTFCLPQLTQSIFFQFHTWGKQKALGLFCLPQI